MSTQDATDISFSSSHHQQSFKLMELPSELLALLESENPPTLYLKSAAPSTPSGVAHAILCSPDKTYRIQQKNSSNPIMILQSSCVSAATPDEVPRPSVTAIATIEDTLELYDQEAEIIAAPKVNKWHEKFAKSRLQNKPKQ